MADADYHDRLDAWHLELSIVQDAFERVSVAISEDQEVGAIAHVLSACFHDLVEKCPFPERSGNEA